jgi:large subunit ribosomal protein L18
MPKVRPPPPVPKRRLEGKTDYRRRKAILISRRPFAAVRIGSKNLIVQVAEARESGDLMLASAHSRELHRYGWKGSGKSMPTTYLTGLLCGLKAAKAGVTQAVLYTGIRRYRSNSRLAAALMGLLDAGLQVPHGEEALAEERRVKGEHIAEYAKALKEQDEEQYRRRFSRLLERGLKPEEYPKHFEEVRKAIMAAFGREVAEDE